MTFLSPMSSRVSLRPLTNSRGQGLIEYLIIVALVAVVAIGAMRVVGQNVKANFANISNALRGEGADKHSLLSVSKSSTAKAKDLGDFMQGAAGKE